jgi:hypothetical protein
VVVNVGSRKGGEDIFGGEDFSWSACGSCCRAFAQQTSEGIRNLVVNSHDAAGGVTDSNPRR